MMNALPVILWLIVLLAYAARPLFRAVVNALNLLRGKSLFEVVAVAALLVVAAVYAVDKPPPPPPPPPPLEKRINIYYEDATGRLVPFEAPILEVLP